MNYGKIIFAISTNNLMCPIQHSFACIISLTNRVHSVLSLTGHTVPILTGITRRSPGLACRVTGSVTDRAYVYAEVKSKRMELVSD